MNGMHKKILYPALFFIFLALVYSVCGTLRESEVPEMDAGLVSVSERMAFGVTIIPASSALGRGGEASIDEAGAKKGIDAAVLLGADFIRIDLEKRTLEKEDEMDKMDSVTAYARERGLGIELDYLGRREWSDAGPERTYGGGGEAEWEEFKVMYQEDAESLARRYEPEYFLILPDCPSVIGRQIDSERSPGEWLGFMKKVALAVRKNSADSKIVSEAVISSDGSVRGETEFAGEMIRDNDPAIDIIAIKARSADEMEKGIKSLLQVTGKHHWHGAVWLSEVEFSGSDMLSGADREIRQKDFLLYAIHLASTNDFGAVSLAGLRGGDGDGILRDDYSPKPAYDAIAEVMSDRGR